ncbi:hypothetical protein OE88DRAFT_139533 [Heliocybe sulcata]|uniref:Uncharacterized protein n=1 Tax=Heliocybe sulcata TaxID=5364 RepID=A0A5C3NKN5_9AGAM|nr:hypothetical protein OE88DRAFT_139533 [Heliocybe sulcata]
MRIYLVFPTRCLEFVASSRQTLAKTTVYAQLSGNPRPEFGCSPAWIHGADVRQQAHHGQRYPHMHAQL